MYKACVRDADLGPLDEVGQHDDVSDVLLPDHPPMIHHSVHTGSCNNIVLRSALYNAYDGSIR